MKVFWSWQSDTPGKTGRFFVRDALKAAVEALRTMPDIDEPRRDALHLDHDREGIPGSPELVRTILEKIEKADVLVADVTSVAARSEKSQGRLINSNVAIELGYALHALTDRKVLMVFNTFYGKHEELPFDLRHRGGAITFELAPDATPEEIEKSHKSLVADFVRALKIYIQEPEKQPAPRAPSTTNKAFYFPPGEVLVEHGLAGEDQLRYRYETGVSLAYLRLIPATRLTRPTALPLLVKACDETPLLTRQLGTMLTGLNKYGAVRYDPGPRPTAGAMAPINASTQLFPSGEIWSIGSTLIIREHGHRPATIPLPFTSALVLEQVYYDKLRALLEFASQHLNLEPPWQVECGLAAIDGLTLVVPPEEYRGPIRTGTVSVERTLKARHDEAVNAVLLEFFNEIHNATGYARPEKLGGFPPDRPSGYG